MNAATYKWIPEACPGQAGPVGGLAGGIGAFGGFVIPAILGTIMQKGEEYYAYSLFTFTAMAVVMILTNLELWNYLKNNPPLESGIQFTDAISCPPSPLKFKSDEPDMDNTREIINLQE